MNASLAQKIALMIGKDGGPNSWYTDVMLKKYNRCVYVRHSPVQVVKAIGCITWSDLPRVIRARFRK